MKGSIDRIRVSHAGALQQPAELEELVIGDSGKGFEQRLPGAVRDAVKHQAEIGIDVVNDGELSKRGGFSGYARERLGGLEQKPVTGGPMNVSGRDARDFPGFYAAGLGGFGPRRARIPGSATMGNEPVVCTAPLEYIGRANVETDIANFKAALDGLDVEGYLPAIAPGTIEHWLRNEHYPNDEAFLFAISEAMHEEYAAIANTGLILQIDDPDLLDGWQVFPDMSVDDYRKYAELRIEALNHGLRGIPEEQVRLHVCWGSGHGPHSNDIPLENMVDLILKVNAQCYSIEASNPRHDHEWWVWEETKLPEDKILMPGVVGHVTDLVEHPQLVADRLVRYADLVGKERVIAGTDCGLGPRVGHVEIVWAKLTALAEGARLATQELWG